VTTIVHSTSEIERLIPHRHPFLLVDRIVEYDAEAKRFGRRSVQVEIIEKGDGRAQAR